MIEKRSKIDPQNDIYQLPKKSKIDSKLIKN